MSKELDRTKVVDETGNVRELTKHEREQLAWNYAHRKGKYFWPLLIGGIVLIALVVWLLRSFNIIPIK